MSVRLAPSVWTVLALLVGPAAAMAQTDAHLMLDDWTKEKYFETQADVRVAPRTSIGGGEHSDFARATAAGRVRLDPSMGLSPTFGYDYTHISLSGGMRLPSQLDDVSVALGSPLFHQGDWFGGASVGLGYAGDAAFAADQAWYGRGVAFVGKDLGDGRTLIFDLQYDGNRTLFPDVPLPSVEYDWKVNDTLEVGVGFPTSAVEWHPAPLWTLSAEYDFPFTANASAQYQFTPWLAGALAYDTDADAFHSNRYGEDQRLFYDTQRVELSAIATPFEGCKVDAGIGYAWDRKFSSGFDERDTDTQAKLASTAYLRLGIEFNF